MNDSHPGEPIGSDKPIASVAVPLPIATTLDYLVPPSLMARAVPGSRARVQVGRRTLTGMILGRHARDSQSPKIKLKPLASVLDLTPVLPNELLELGAFVAEYYLAPIGEVFRAVLPSGIEGWGTQRVWLTDQGALAAPRNSLEQRIVEVLRPAGRITLGDLENAVGGEGFRQAVEALVSRRWLTVAEPRLSGSRYVKAIELASGDLAELTARCGKSSKARAVVEYLAEIGAPVLRATAQSEVGCSPSVIRRLEKLGIIRTFTQMARLALDQHRVGKSPVEKIVLRPDQKAATEALLEALRGRRFAPFFLRGMTGSGKTEVYLRAIATVLESEGSAIVLVPEIALVPALAQTLRERFGNRAAILHSALSVAERRQEWERIRSGEARVVLGPRSAVFAPVKGLRLIAVDEEHDSAYKQESTPRYNARDIALWRGREAQAAVVLVSATPSLESRLNIEREKLTALTLTERVGVGSLPEGILVDLRELDVSKRPGEIHFSPRLLAELESTLAAGDQAILLRNRRGYSPLLLCRACGEDLRCEDCGLPRTYHKRFNELQCHYCGSRQPIPENCPACGEHALEPIGSGTERVEENFEEQFPGVPVAVLDRDTVRRRGGVARVLERFGRGEARVLIGTQMVAKGHHFPGVALAAVLQADTYLSFPDFRAVERTYNLLTQLAGRAGRGSRPGRVLIQSFHPDHYAIRAALEQDDAAFAEEEIRFRRVFHYPPFTRMVQLLVRDRNRERGAQTAERLAYEIGRHDLAANVRIGGPAPAPFERLRGKWRFQILVRGPSAAQLRKLVQATLPSKTSSEIVIDVDPLELL